MNFATLARGRAGGLGRHRETVLVGRADVAGQRQGRFDRAGQQSHVPRANVRERGLGQAARSSTACRRRKGNGYWSQEIYYQILNSGLRIPPTAGSASGVLPNPVGYNRVYAQVGGELTPERWWEAVKAGRTFVTNGPLLRVQADGQWPGHVFSAANGKRVSAATLGAAHVERPGASRSKS